MSTTPKTLRHYSRQEWTSEQPNQTDINGGSLQRIADASERMATAADLVARGYQLLTDERDRYKHWYESELSERQRIERSNRALRAWITRLQRQRQGPRHE